MQLNENETTPCRSSIADQADLFCSHQFAASRKVVFAGPLPPPSHGMANVNRDMVAKIAERATIIVLGVQPPALRRGLGYHLAKARRALIAAAGILRARLGGADVFYGSVDDGFGGLWTVIFASVARAAGLRIFLHHHSYKYILQRTQMMCALVFVAGPRTHHVMLCDEMTAAFSSLYPRAKRLLAVPNAVAEPVLEIATRRSAVNDGVTIGLLANLTREKGLMAFVEILEEWHNANLRGILAGPIPDPDDESYVRQALERLGGRLTWLGAVSGKAKEEFFAEIDLFIFPTSYPAETLSLVLIEALVRGVPCIVPKRGCMCVFEKLSSVDVVPLNSDFAAAARRGITKLLVDPGEIAASKVIAQKEGRELNRVHQLAQSTLARQICGELVGDWTAP